MVILLIGMFIGLISALAGAKKAGLVAGWTTLLNASVAMYLAVYITPAIADSVAIVANFPYGAVLAAFLIAVIMFAILNAIASAVTGDLKIAMPRLVELLGGGAVGFINGMLLWGFICLLLDISPLADSSIVKDTCQSPTEISQMWKGSVGASVAVLNTASWQSGTSSQDLCNIVTGLKDIAKPKTKAKPAPVPDESSESIEPDPNSSGT